MYGLNLPLGDGREWGSYPGSFLPTTTVWLGEAMSSQIRQVPLVYAEVFVYAADTSSAVQPALHSTQKEHCLTQSKVVTARNS